MWLCLMAALIRRPKTGWWNKIRHMGARPDSQQLIFFLLSCVFSLPGATGALSSWRETPHSVILFPSKAWGSPGCWPGLHSPLSTFPCPPLSCPHPLLPYQPLWQLCLWQHRPFCDGANVPDLPLTALHRWHWAPQGRLMQPRIGLLFATWFLITFKNVKNNIEKITVRCNLVANLILIK